MTDAMPMTTPTDDSSFEHVPLDVHPAANLFPVLNEKRMMELIDDIEQNGQRVPIGLHRGKVLDGRNRLAECGALGIEPRTEALPDLFEPRFGLPGRRGGMPEAVRPICSSRRRRSSRR